MPHRISPAATNRSRVTSLGVRGLLTSGFTLGVLALWTPNTAYAWDCPGVTEAQIEICEREGRQTPTPAPSSGGSGSSFFDDWGGLLFAAGIIAFIAWVVIANLRESAAEKQQRGAAELARGRQIAEAAHAAAVQRAHAEAAAQVPPREQWDPHGVGLAPPPMPAPKVPPAPPTSPTDLARYAAFGDVVPWIEGSALAAVTAPNGDRSKAEAAFAEAVRTANVGTTDENGTFIPDATLASVRAYLDGSGDVEFVAQPRDLTIGEKQLAKITHFLLLTARVASAGNWEREVETGRYMIRLSMNAKAAQQQEQKPAEPEQPRVDPRWA
ncbi:Uncharacterised protein [Mycobacteroides abscessus subsp. massiliense]|uniref:hypothetical protein n=1 Tax=Mycobacteroides abscessus TaxID=36809 RepID=UPI0009A83588|nr:hypothetical protein [Mycobacteroides abscessus]SKE70550.1 Uncharacterised protein [Mycobacteroides abscessus subsp. massiliense]SKH80662.1 Uncharacterised protein [Mycobacteroides abscessus subsp. massiliense]SKI34259.1 Uncharacterised protein [Mycobacteroides abscessus subsp. massiliense]SKJ36690.1 Uncharacterised protein [Mycobacteroides abscessus subsp. massiliense]SKK23392.1 Uncharacterised protein [Mycobacteroides abscessus subsp. massiliense]